MIDDVHSRNANIKLQSYVHISIWNIYKLLAINELFQNYLCLD